MIELSAYSHILYNFIQDISAISTHLRQWATTCSFENRAEGFDGDGDFDG